MSEVVLYETRDFHLDQFSSLSHLKKENEERKKKNKNVTLLIPAKANYFHPCAVELHLSVLPWPKKKSFECGE